MKHQHSLVWLRRDLRLEDNTAISKACSESSEVTVVFVFDTQILGKLKSKMDHRLTFIHDSVLEIDNQLKALGSSLIVLVGDPAEEIPKFANTLKVNALYFNMDYEPYAKSRDKKVRESLKANNINCYEFKDHVIFSGSEIVKADGSPYKMFTPYKNSWLKAIKTPDFAIRPVDKKRLESKKALSLAQPIPSLKDLGFERTKLEPAFQAGRARAVECLKQWTLHLDNYESTRNFPSLDHGTSGLSVHLRFGTVSVRECVSLAMSRSSSGSQTWLSELIWRDFYQMILDQFPHVAKGAFKKEYDQIKWLGTEANFKAWRDGRTGFPIVDAGMRQLNQTGWMHNRLRMITASFLVKDLLVDWQKGESYFAEKLIDFDLAANNGGWQWCASTGCDAQPYFRIFNPVLQSQKFDPDATFIKKWVPELKNLSPKEIHQLSDVKKDGKSKSIKSTTGYPEPIVNHQEQKRRAMKMYNTIAK